MHYITTFLDPSEPCMGGWEGYENAPIPGGKNGETGWRWLQKIFVVRDDTISKYVTDLGPGEDYEGRITPITIPCHGEYDVAAIQYLLEQNRHDTYWQERAKAQQAESTLIADLLEQQEKIRAVVLNRTSNGPYATVQRNGWDHTAASRQETERRRGAWGKKVF